MNEYENADKKQQDIINQINDYNKEEIGDMSGDTDSESPEIPDEPKPPQEDGIEVGDILTAEDIAKVEDKSEIYGAEVKGYDCENNAGVESWKLFYADNENVYLMASNYIHKDYCPNGRYGTPIADNGNGYYLSIGHIISDYNGTRDITEKKIKKLNEGYFNKYGSENSAYANMKAVAYMLDTSKEVWGKFAGDKAEYAIGGPTLELLFKSYNEKYNTNNKYQVQAVSPIGYRISADGGNSFNDYITNSADYLNKEDDLYVIDETDKAIYMWLASPSDETGYCLLGVHNLGNVTDNDCSFYAGFRPVVCLRSNVQLEKQQDGSFLLK